MGIDEDDGEFYKLTSKSSTEGENETRLPDHAPQRR
jgi:hypothetical protein